MGTGGFLFFEGVFELLRLSVSPKDLKWMKKQDKCRGGDVKAGEQLPESGEEDGQLSRSWQWIWFYFVGEGRWRREADRSTVQDGGGGKTQSSCSWISGQREGGNGILAVWQKAALLWYAVGNVACGGTVAGNHQPPPKRNKKKTKKTPNKTLFPVWSRRCA